MFSDDDDPAIIGRRAADGNLISFREAVKLFATKESLEAQGQTVAAIARRVDNMPTREEHELRWEREKEFRDNTDRKLDLLLSARLPKWVVPTLGLILTAFAIGLTLYTIFGVHHA